MQELYKMIRKSKIKDRALKSENQVYVNHIFPDF